MLDYLRENYSQILTLIFIGICIILIIVSFFKKDENNKKGPSLILFKEHKYNDENSKNVNTYALIRKYILIYQVVLYDNKGNKIFFSNYYPSREKAISDFERLKDSIKISKKITNETIDHQYFSLMMVKDKVIGFSNIFDTFEELDRSLKLVDKSIESPLNTIPQFDNSISSYNRLNKPIKIKNLILDKVLDNYEIDLKADNQIILKSFQSNDKNDLKEVYEDVEEALLKKRFYIEEFNDKYRYVLLSNRYKIVCFGSLKESKDEVFKELDTINNSLR